MTKAQMSSTRYRLRRNIVRAVEWRRRLEGPDPGHEKAILGRRQAQLGTEAYSNHSSKSAWLGAVTRCGSPRVATDTL
jgi:hypothetical protein